MTDPDIAVSVQMQIAARQAAQERARHIIETAENLEFVVKSEVGRRMSEHLHEIAGAVDTAIAVIEKRKRVSRVLVIRALNGLRNRFAAFSQAYQSGALPK